MECEVARPHQRMTDFPLDRPRRRYIKVHDRVPLYYLKKGGKFPPDQAFEHRAMRVVSNMA
jgi:hypothetical protein